MVDDTGSVSVVFWDRLANDLLQRTAAELKNALMNVSTFNCISAVYNFVELFNDKTCFYRRVGSMTFQMNVT